MSPTILRLMQLWVNLNYANCPSGQRRSMITRRFYGIGEDRFDSNEKPINVPVRVKYSV